jgi:hypothetical protein
LIKVATRWRFLRFETRAAFGSIWIAWAELLCSAQSAFCAHRQSSSAHAIQRGHSARAPQNACFIFRFLKIIIFVFLRELCCEIEEKIEKKYLKI